MPEPLPSALTFTQIRLRRCAWGLGTLRQCPSLAGWEMDTLAWCEAHAEKIARRAGREVVFSEGIDEWMAVVSDG